ncbi:uncharacterized protein LOC132193861 [Neocloeon triangulifer]|uniref:uncharacterized protein LOC132193861 n=1 Tax=Neocloeon triangulifer TaxID=2078957 RepID=UPI00286ED01C|nr:uncharacterized protein LOC132193861 [Neocloeon triangulifer]
MQEVVEYAEIVQGPTIGRAKTGKTSVKIKSQDEEKKCFGREGILKVVLITLALLGNALLVYFLLADRVGAAEERLAKLIEAKQNSNKQKTSSALEKCPNARSEKMIKHSNGKKYYFFYPERANWDLANQTCGQMNSHLVTLNEQTEVDAVGKKA